MDEVWQRVEQELAAKNKNVAWLARKMGMDSHRLYNWSRRGVPPSAYAPLAAALGRSLDWVTGGGAASVSDYSPMAIRIATEFDKIKDEATQLATFAHIIGVIARASGGAPEPPTMTPGPGPNGGPRQDS